MNTKDSFKPSEAFIIIGYGGHTQDIIEIVMTQDKPVLGYLDDHKTGEFILGTIEDYQDIVDKHDFDIRYVIGINSSSERKRLSRYMDDMGAVPGNLIHKTAIIGHNVTLGKGIVMGPYSVCTSNVVVGDHTHLNTAASINQGSTVGKFCTLSPGARICGDVTVGDAVSFGANSTVINLKTIGSNVTVGAGAVVVSDVPSGITVVGIPAKEIRRHG